MNFGHLPMGERRIREAMAIEGRLKPDGAWSPIVSKSGKVEGYYQNNRKYRRSRGRAA